MLIHRARSRGLRQLNKLHVTPVNCIADDANQSQLPIATLQCFMFSFLKGFHQGNSIYIGFIQDFREMREIRHHLGHDQCNMSDVLMQ